MTMTANARLVEQAQIVSGFLPVNLATGANTGDWVCLKGFERIAVVFFKGAGTAGDDPTITIEQATAVAGTGNKALNFTDIFVKQDTVLTSVGQWTHTTQSAGNTYTDATSAEDAAIWVIEFEAGDLDVDGGFDCVQASVGDVGTNSQIGCLLYFLWPAHHGQAADSVLSAIAD